MDNEFEKEFDLEQTPEEPVTPPEEDTTYRYIPEPAPEYVAAPKAQYEPEPDPMPSYSPDTSSRYNPESAPHYRTDYRADPPPKRKKKGHGKRMVALGLVCAIVGGICGMGGTVLGLRLLSG